MLDHLFGRITSVEPTQVVVQAGGIGFELLVPLSTSAALTIDKEETLYTHLHVADPPKLLGFTNREERNFCRRLLRVNGVGPAIAIAILSQTSLAQVKAALATGDEAFLTAVRGIGRKTAQRLILDLGEEMEKEGQAPPAQASRVEADAVAALLALGYSQKEASRAVAQARKKKPDAPAGDLIRLALSG